MIAHLPYPPPIIEEKLIQNCNKLVYKVVNFLWYKQTIQTRREIKFPHLIEFSSSRTSRVWANKIPQVLVKAPKIIQNKNSCKSFASKSTTDFREILAVRMRFELRGQPGKKLSQLKHYLKSGGGGDFLNCDLLLSSALVGSGGGLVGRAVASDSRDPLFDSRHQQNYTSQLYIQSIEETKIKEKRPGIAHLVKKVEPL